MLCILKFAPLEEAQNDYVQHSPGDEIDGWIIATDIHDARRKADAAVVRDLAECLYRMDFMPQPGKHVLPTGHVMLVS